MRLQVRAPVRRPGPKVYVKTPSGVDGDALAACFEKRWGRGALVREGEKIDGIRRGYVPGGVEEHTSAEVVERWTLVQFRADWTSVVWCPPPRRAARTPNHKRVV